MPHVTMICNLSNKFGDRLVHNNVMVPLYHYWFPSLIDLFFVNLYDKYICMYVCMYNMWPNFGTPSTYAPECKITAGQMTFSGQNHNLSGHIYICMEKLSRWNFNLANIKLKANSINFKTMSRQLHLCPFKFYQVLTVCQPMLQKLFCTLMHLPRFREIQIWNMQSIIAYLCLVIAT